MSWDDFWDFFRGSNEETQKFLWEQIEEELRKFSKNHKLLLEVFGNSPTWVQKYFGIVG